MGEGEELSFSEGGVLGGVATGCRIVNFPAVPTFLFFLPK